MASSCRSPIGGFFFCACLRPGLTFFAFCCFEEREGLGGCFALCEYRLDLPPGLSFDAILVVILSPFVHVVFVHASRASSSSLLLSRARMPVGVRGGPTSPAHLRVSGRSRCFPLRSRFSVAAAATHVSGWPTSDGIITFGANFVPRLSFFVREEFASASHMVPSSTVPPVEEAVVV